MCLKYRIILLLNRINISLGGSNIIILYFKLITHSRIDEVIVYIEEFRNINFKYSVICLQETWLSENDDLSPFQIEGYNCVSQGKSCSNKGSLLLYIDSKVTFETKMNFNMYQHWEGITEKISGNGLPNQLTIFKLSRPPRSNQILKQFIEELTPIIDTIISQNHNIALVGDTNINLLKMHENSIHCDFFDLIMSYSLNPRINLPTRFTETKGTLIDNIFCKLLTPTNINCAGILINKCSDHQPCFIILNAGTKKTHTPNLVKLKIITQNALLNIKNDLMMTNIHGQLDQSPSADVNSNYDIMFNGIHRVVDKHISSKTVKFNKYKHKQSNWITHGVIKSIKYRDKLYKLLKMTPRASVTYTTQQINLKTYKSILKKLFVQPN